MESKIRSHSGARGLTTEQSDDLPSTGASLIAVSLLSLAFLAAIWVVVGSLASALIK